MHLSVVGRLEVGVPAGAPLDGRRLEYHVVRPDHLGGLGLLGVEEEGRRRQRNLVRRRARVEGAVVVLAGDLVEALVKVDLVHVGVLHAVRLHLEADDAHAVARRVLVVQDREPEVVEEDNLAGGAPLLRILPLVVVGVEHLHGAGAGHVPEGVPRLVRLQRRPVVRLVEDGHGDREVVEEEVRAVVLLDHQRERLDLLLGVLLAAEDLAVLVHTHRELVRQLIDSRAPQHLTQVQRVLIDHVDTLVAEGENIVLIRELSPHRGERLHLGL
mmetsp:Transcript_58537/g.137511  ORF Transcript_58537/g.137511 Transcript_58537/m.137511 type:complete len:271 (+) Transcript_58537:842-1654(+)